MNAIDPTATPGDRCSTCPVTLPACAGQYNRHLCGPDDGSDTDAALAGFAALRESQSRTISAILFGWPAPTPGGFETLGGGGGLDTIVSGGG